MGGVWSDVHLLHVASISYPIQFEVQDNQTFTISLNHVFNAQTIEICDDIPCPMRHPNIHTLTFAKFYAISYVLQCYMCPK
jgi:hypothetical protein